MSSGDWRSLDRSEPPMTRWRAIDGRIRCLDPADQIEFRDAMSDCIAAAQGRNRDFYSWEKVPWMPAELAHDLLDRAVEITERLVAVTTSPRVRLVSDSVDPVLPPGEIWAHGASDPFDVPEWWPFELSNEDVSWKYRSERCGEALAFLDDEEQGEIITAMLDELAESHVENPSVRFLLQTGRLHREAAYVTIPILETSLGLEAPGEP